MHEFKRSKRIQEQIKLGDDIISIDLDAESIAMDFNARHGALIKAESKLRELSGDSGRINEAMQYYGEAVISLFQLIFGEEGTEKILAFYENRYVEMSAQVFPFIIDTVVPQVSEALQVLRGKAAQKYKPNRKEHRARLWG